MGAPEQDLASVLGQRESVLVGDGETTSRAPWGPALTALLEQALNDDVEPLEGRQGERPDNVPMPTRAMFGPRTPHPPSVVLSDVGERWRDAPDDDERAVEPRDAVEREADDLAETTRQQLTRMYDSRVAAPTLVDPDASATPPRPEMLSAPRARTRPRALERVVGTPRPGRRRVLIAVALVVVALLGVRYVRGAIAKDEAAAVSDVTTPVDGLPWRTVRYGDLLVELPTKSSSATLADQSGSSYRYDRYVLPDITLTVTVRGPNPALSSDSALRSYTSSLATQLGGRLLLGLARDVTFGTSFSASLDLPDGPAQMYVLSTSGSLIELRADIPDEESGRAMRIYERVIRSFSPA